MWPFATDGRGSSTPAHPQQYTPLEPSTDVCRRPGCAHITPGADDPSVPLPAFPWLTPACQRAWTVAQQPPLAMCTAYIDPPAVKSTPAPWPWLPDPVAPSKQEAA